LFTHKVLKALLHKELITQDNIDYLMSQKHTGFSAWMGERVDPTDEPFRLFLARYIDRGPIANSKIQIDDDIVTYVTEKDSKTHEFSALEFLARVTAHIPNKWESTTRYYGVYSSRTRSVQKKRLIENPGIKSETTLIPCSLEPQSIRKASKTWASLIKRVFEVDPLICPKCSSTMRIVSFITDSNEVNRLLKNLGIPAWTTPEPIKSNAPPNSEPTIIPIEE
jgi:hypothetical protein